MYVAMIQTKKTRGPEEDPGWAVFGPFTTRMEASKELTLRASPGVCFVGSILKVHDSSKLDDVRSGTFEENIRSGTL